MVEAIGGRRRRSRRNGGLSAARNSGIDFALKAFPAAEAFFFLDADNRMSSFSLARLESALDASEADWFFPDIEMFGSSDASFDFSGPYSPYLHILQNICEAGSLVRRRVFDAGVRFDENMRLGYEDWDFWLTAVERGFRGTHLAASGFQYRKRAESMVSSSARIDAIIMNYIRNKHRWISDPCALTALEQDIAPRYAVIDATKAQVVMGSDPTAFGPAMPLSVYCEVLRKSLAAPSRQTPGAIIVFMPHRLLTESQVSKIANWLFLEVERVAKDGKIVVLPLPNDAGPGEHGRACVTAMTASWLFKFLDSPDAVAQASLDAALLEHSVLNTFLAGVPSEIKGEIDEMENLRAFLCKTKEKRTLPRRSGRRRALIGRTELHMAPFLARGAFAEGESTMLDTPLPNRIRPRRSSWALVVDGDAIGSEPTLATFAQALTEYGYRPDLIVLGPGPSIKAKSLREAFEALFFFDHSVHEFGTRDQRLFANVLSSYEAVLVGSSSALQSLAVVRNRGVVTAVVQAFASNRWLDPHCLSDLISFEHVIDLFVAEPTTMYRELVARGIPSTKISAFASAASRSAFEAAGKDFVRTLVASFESTIETRRVRTDWR